MVWLQKSNLRWCVTHDHILKHIVFKSELLFTRFKVVFYYCLYRTAQSVVHFKLNLEASFMHVKTLFMKPMIILKSLQLMCASYQASLKCVSFLQTWCIASLPFFFRHFNVNCFLELALAPGRNCSGEDSSSQFHTLLWFIGLSQHYISIDSDI